MDQADDLKAFERRMIEIVSSLQPSIWRWRVILFILVVVTLLTFYALITDDSFNASSSVNQSSDNSFLSTIYSHLFCKKIYFSISISFLIFAFLFGIHRKMFSSSIIIARFRYILADYNMSCDSDGRLIIKPRPTPPYLTASS
ncbi:unnamed protein product [Adineta ricciae]|uniref:Transmembrane protein 188 n=1 Tax=Adineta ricciae TaxID=249248 RepID=A0A813SHA7_ADIRI|nr:unnamed protein product [Adineta ricciae]CAF1181904.1 unnamed protein product [Adineta ricciae]